MNGTDGTTNMVLLRVLVACACRYYSYCCKAYARMVGRIHIPPSLLLSDWRDTGHGDHQRRLKTEDKNEFVYHAVDNRG